MNPEQKKIVAISTVGGLAVAGLLAYGISGLVKTSDAEKRAKGIKSSIEQVASEGIAPTPERLDALTRLSGEYSATVSGVNSKILKFAPKEFANLSPSALMGKVRQQTQAFKTKAGESGLRLPENFLFGFEAYERKDPSAQSPGVLNYEFDAIEWLLNQAALANCSEILNINRVQLDEEKTEAQPAPKSKASKALPDPIRLLPMEITLRGDRSSVAKILESIANSPTYFFRIKGMRIGNERPAPPLIKDVRFAGEPQVDASAPAGFPDFPDPEATPKAPADKPAGDILKQVVGNEKVTIHLALDLVLLDSAQLQVKKARATTPATRNSDPVDNSESNSQSLESPETSN